MEIITTKIGNGFVEVKETQICPRCGSSGKLPQYNHVQNGICFKCWGKKKTEKTYLLL